MQPVDLLGKKLIGLEQNEAGLLGSTPESPHLPFKSAAQVRGMRQPAAASAGFPLALLPAPSTPYT